MCTMAINNQFNGIELTFEAKPAEAIRTAMKSAGFRWHRQKKLWYAKNTAERMALARQLSGQNSHADAFSKIPEIPMAVSETVSRYGIKVGDILSGSWGYSMTLVEFYKVTKILSPCRVEIQKIGTTCVDADRGGGERLMPNPENVIGEPEQKTVQKDRYYVAEERWYIKTEYCKISPWNGQPAYQNTWD